MSAVGTILKIMNPEERHAIHSAAITLLTDFGMKIESLEMLKALEKDGCKINYESKIARYSAPLIERTIELIATEHSSKIVPIEERNKSRASFEMAGGGLGYLEWPSGKIKKPCAKDAAFLIQLCEAMGDEFNHTCMPLLYSVDLDGSEFDPRLWAIRSAGLLVKNSGKAYYHDVNSILELDYLMELGIAIKGSKEEYLKDPILITCQCCREPLNFDNPWADIFAEMAKRGLRCDIGVMPISGGTTPITPASAVVVAIAEILAVLTAVKLINPEAPTGYVCLSGQINMASGNSMMFSPLVALQDAAVVEICTQLYNWAPNCHSLYVDGTLPAAQSSIERALSYFRNAAIGAKDIRFPGFIGQSKIISPEQMLIDMDSGRWVDMFFQGFEVNEETLAVDELRNLGPGANFLTTNHTFDNYKDFLWQPDTFSNSIDMPGNINALSDQNLMNRANEKIKQLMENHTPYSLDEGLEREVDNIVHTGEKELVKALKSGTLK